ncbi:ATP synthase subunit C lysine N-methyltransferase isoform X2 [Nerophis ophidion]|uniref:ATP synthase subunit C lysine N-methyltransferase isoform X2 n=1 Tax=Nerophis ophidion TaxID=159077 RepID=UPI002AE008B1|nr:ATP synthase subunit C lysine N-methyltransferase isoform X2 [Nerophis ophidion]XP_061756868.1 ATP synthase subunit C lysine N-methyltransferase isoform X2 [Nerophis ophidion]
MLQFNTSSCSAFDHARYVNTTPLCQDSVYIIIKCITETCVCVCTVFQVPYLPSNRDQTRNVMKLLEGRTGCLADLGSGDGRLVFAASSAGFKCTGFEINSILLAYARTKARWTGVPSSQANFVKKDFWKTDLSKYNNITAFLAPGAMEVLGDKLLKELPDGALVISCRFHFPYWPHQSTVGSGLDQTWAYDITAVRKAGLREVSNVVEDR